MRSPLAECEGKVLHECAGFVCCCQVLGKGRQVRSEAILRLGREDEYPFQGAVVKTVLHAVAVGNACAIGNGTVCVTGAVEELGSSSWSLFKNDGRVAATKTCINIISTASLWDIVQVGFSPKLVTQTRLGSSAGHGIIVGATCMSL